MISLDPARVAALRALAEAATPGPWELRALSTCYHVLDTPSGDGTFQTGCISFDGSGKANAAFIAAARQAVPELLDALRDAEAENARLRAWFECAPTYVTTGQYGIAGLAFCALRGDAARPASGAGEAGV